MMSFEEFLKKIVAALEAAGVEYLLGGALAAWAWGEPRATQDIDLVVNLPPEKVNALSKELEKIQIYVPAEIMLDILAEPRADLAINAIHGGTGFKAEFFPLRAGDDLRASALARKVQVNLGPSIGKIFVHSPEDLIIYKLLYFSQSQQTKHIRDIGAIYQARKATLDGEYIQDWAGILGVRGLLDEILSQLGYTGATG
ncbi:MAG: hypothetical protein EPO32_06680 [Anaerolineae bacterium]|nr:MAG: hypothetical protein EPO32_06680 [Anaerolineae bacterium]